MSAPVITFLSDYGHADEFVGVCHGVIARALPARARDRHQPRDPPPRRARRRARAARGALALHARGRAPGRRRSRVGAVGRTRAARGRARTADEARLLVGPDNGLLMPAAERLGGVVEAVDDRPLPERLRAGLGAPSTAATSSRPSPPRSPPASRSRRSASRWRRGARALELPRAHVARRRAGRARAARRPLRQPDPRRLARAARGGRAGGWATRCGEAGGATRTRALRVARSPTWPPASCCSTRTRSAWSRSRSTAARRAELLGDRRGDEELLVRPA